MSTGHAQGMRPAPGRRRRTRGAALITAILVVALVSVIAGSMAWQQGLQIRRTANVLQADQAYQYALGVEDWARGVLWEDLQARRAEPRVGPWAWILPETAIEGGRVRGRVEDVQGRLNLNNLVQNGRLSLNDLVRLRRLFRVLDLDEGPLPAVADWVDADIDPVFPGGAEDDFYLRGDPPYRTANGPMAHASELRLVRGISAAAFAQLAPSVIALPRPTSINVNTAPVPVLMALVEGLDPADAAALVDFRAETPFQQIEEFFLHPALAGLPTEREGLGIDSDFFLVEGDAAVGTARTRLLSLLERGERGVVVVYRAREAY